MSDADATAPTGASGGSGAGSSAASGSEVPKDQPHPHNLIKGGPAKIIGVKKSAEEAQKKRDAAATAGNEKGVEEAKKPESEDASWA